MAFWSRLLPTCNDWRCGARFRVSPPFFRADSDIFVCTVRFLRVLWSGIFVLFRVIHSFGSGSVFPPVFITPFAYTPLFSQGTALVVWAQHWWRLTCWAGLNGTWCSPCISCLCCSSARHCMATPCMADPFLCSSADSGGPRFALVCVGTACLAWYPLCG